MIGFNHAKRLPFHLFRKKVFSFEKLLSAEMAVLSGSGHVHQRKIVLAESRKYLIYQQLGIFKQSPKTEDQSPYIHVVKDPRGSVKPRRYRKWLKPPANGVRSRPGVQCSAVVIGRKYQLIRLRRVLTKSYFVNTLDKLFTC